MRADVEEHDMDIFNTEGFGGNYQPVRRDLLPQQIMKLNKKIILSENFAFGELSHVVLRGTDRIVGYISNDSAQLCCPVDENFERYRIPHKHLRRIYNSI